MPLRHLTRLVAAAVLAAGAAPVLAATADLTTSLSLDGDTKISTRGFTLGTAESYTFAVVNNGLDPVTEFTVDATIDPALKQVSVSGCVPVATVPDPITNAIPQFPCVWRGLLYATQEADITVSATYPAPSPLNAATAACPNASDDVTTSDVAITSTMSISGIKADGAAVTDPVTTNNTSTATSHLRNWADLSVESLTEDAGGGNVNQGQTIGYTAVVKNLGPCNAPAVRVQFGPAASFSYAAGSATPTTCEATQASDDRCSVGALAKGVSQTVTAKYTLGNYPNDTTQAAATMDVTVSSRATSTAAASDDPHASNNSATASNGVNGLSSGSGCSTGGAGGLLGGLVALAGLRLRRRRA